MKCLGGMDAVSLAVSDHLDTRSASPILKHMEVYLVKSNRNPVELFCILALSISLTACGGDKNTDQSAASTTDGGSGRGTGT
jgi:hypothetical protein